MYYRIIPNILICYRGDTAMILSVTVGVHIGAWLNFQTGRMMQVDLPQPYTVMWPSLFMIGIIIIRTILGFALIFLTRFVGKFISYNFLCTLLRENAENIKKSENTLQNKHKTFIELGCKYFTCALIGFNALYIVPQIFRMIGLERPTFYTEI